MEDTVLGRLEECRRDLYEAWNAYMAARDGGDESEIDRTAVALIDASRRFTRVHMETQVKGADSWSSR